MKVNDHMWRYRYLPFDKTAGDILLIDAASPRHYTFWRRMAYVARAYWQHYILRLW